MNIIVKKHASHSMFRPHYNSSMGRYYHTRDDYMGDIKKYGLEPYRVIEKQKSKPMVMSQEGREMIHQAASYEKRKEKPGSRFVDAINELGVAKKPKWITDAESMVGGFKSDEEA